MTDPSQRRLSRTIFASLALAAVLGACGGGWMSLQEAERRFAEDRFQDRAAARQQATRGTFDPGYFAYTFGKLQILKLREETKARLGAAFSLQRFHEALLSHGGPPVALLRDRVLADLGAARAP